MKFSSRITSHSTRTAKITLNAKSVEGAKREASKWLSEFGKGYSVIVYGEEYSLVKTHGYKWSGLMPEGNY